MKILPIVSDFVVLLIIAAMIVVGALLVPPQKPYTYSTYDTAREAAKDIALNHAPEWADEISLHAAKEVQSGKTVYIIQAKSETGRLGMWTGKEFVAWDFNGK